jgi:DNA mismatch repair ATPase MutS
MQVDATTLRDLDVFTSGTRQGPTLAALVDRTRTIAGRRALEDRLANPAATADAILGLQAAHRLLAADAAWVRATLDAADPDGVERYLRTNWQLPSAAPTLLKLGGRLVGPRWFRDYLAQVEDGQARVSRLLRAADALARRLRPAAPPPLRTAGDTLAALLATPELEAIRASVDRTTTAARLAFDQRARGDGRATLTDLLACLGSIEAMWSLGVATAQHGWVWPTPGAALSITALQHPFVPDCVPNDLTLAPATRVCFVTGPNMAGKSTFLKALGAAMLLAHAGCGVPAAAMTFPPVSTLFSSVQIRDDLAAGESFYLAEVRRVGALARTLRDGRSAFAVLDEPFRGTNVHDSSEATLAILWRLAAHPTALTVIASHLAEIAPSLEADRRVRLLRFTADLSDGAPRFDFRVGDGVSTQRLGMTLLRQEGVLDLLDPGQGPQAYQRRSAVTRSAKS